MATSKLKIDVTETSLTLRRMGDLYFGYFDIFDLKNIHHYYYFSIIAELVIHSRDIIHKIVKLEGDILVDFEETKFKKLEDLVKYFRDAICHNDSVNRKNSKGYIYSHNINAALYFPDEISINTGDTHLHLRRHLFEIFIQSLNFLSRLSDFEKNRDFQFVYKIAESNDALKNPLQFRNVTR